MNTIEIICILIIAFIMDIVAGDPPNSWHPVAWLGKLISWEMKYSPQNSKNEQLAFGIVIVSLTIAGTTAIIYLLILFLQGITTVFFIIIMGILLKFTFSLRGLRQAAITVRNILADNNLKHAQYSVRVLVSRDPSHLNENQVISATVESGAENTCDSFIAPLFYFMLFGLPGAVAYRIINTYDAMIGYHGKWEYLGKFAARLDDAANFIPARLSALIIIVASCVSKKDVKQSWHIMLRDHRKTESPNAGWTMSAMAGALGVQLEKAGYYKLGDNQQSLALETIDASLNLVTLTALIWMFLSVLAQGIYYVAA
jgi:adenosylcobinamide-phosphate synthase